MQADQAGAASPGSPSASATSGPSGEAAAAGDKPAKVVPYNRRLLLKSLLRAIAIASYAPGGAPRRVTFSCARTG